MTLQSPWTSVEIETAHLEKVDKCGADWLSQILQRPEEPALIAKKKATLHKTAQGRDETELTS